MSTRILSVEDVDGVPITSTQVKQAAASVDTAVGVTASLGLAYGSSASVSTVASVTAAATRTQPAAASLGVVSAVTPSATLTRVGSAAVSTTVSATAAAQVLWQYDFDGGSNGGAAPTPITLGGGSFESGLTPLVNDSAVSGDLAVRMPAGTSAEFMLSTHTRTGDFWLSAEVELDDLLVPVSIFLVSKGPTFPGFPDSGGYLDYNIGYTVCAGLVGSPATHGTTPGIFVGAMTHQDSEVLGNDADIAALDDITITAIPGGWPSGPMRLEFQWSPDTNTGIQIKCWLDPTSNSTPDAVATSSASWVLRDENLDPWPLTPRVGASTDAVGWAVGARGSDETQFGPQPFLDTGHSMDIGAFGFSADTWVGPWR